MTITMTDDPGERVIGWFSCGAPSAIAVKLALAKWGDRVVIVRCDPGAEHPDNARFIRDCEEWYGQEIIEIRSDKYTSPIDVADRTGYVVGPRGARCTVELKKKPRENFERPTDLHVWGFAFDEQNRSERFVNDHPGVACAFPLVEHELTKAVTLSLVERAGIRLPDLYEMGFSNNNCIGCVKAGMGHWNMVRRDFPDVFDAWAKQERETGHAILSEELDPNSRKTSPVWLDELDPDRGDIRTDPVVDCSLACPDAEVAMLSRPAGPLDQGTDPR